MYWVRQVEISMVWRHREPIAEWAGLSRGRAVPACDLTTHTRLRGVLTESHASPVLAQLVAAGPLTRNVATLVDGVPGKDKKLQTFTPDQVQIVLPGIANSNRHASQVRRGKRHGDTSRCGSRNCHAAGVAFFPRM